MASRVALLLLTFLVACWWTPGSYSQHGQCETLDWDSSYGDNPLQPHVGKVVLVALMKGYCNYCIQQARLLQSLRGRLIGQGMSDIAFMIVNGGERSSQSRISNLQNEVTFQVLQDSPDHYMFRRAFHGLKDDVLIFDRCGQRSFFVPRPYSNVAHNITERLLRRAYAGTHFCYCHRDPVRSRHYGRQ